MPGHNALNFTDRYREPRQYNVVYGSRFDLAHTMKETAPRLTADRGETSDEIDDLVICIPICIGVAVPMFFGRRGYDRPSYCSWLRHRLVHPNGAALLDRQLEIFELIYRASATSFPTLHAKECRNHTSVELFGIRASPAESAVIG